MELKVLIVDDEETIRKDIRQAFQVSDIKVTIVEAVDGQDAFLKATSVADFNFFVVDYNMPKMNGLEFLEKLFHDGQYKSVPIMLYTTETDPTLVKKARDLSTNIKWVIKPLAGDPFIAAVKGCVSRNSKAAA